MATYSETIDFLYALKNRGSKYGIDRMRLFVEALGQPQRAFPLIHVAGTNGKGSVCAMLEAIYRDNGYKTGFFSSPHLVHLGERAQVDREILSDEAIIQYTEQLRPVAAEIGQDDPDLHPTFFEFIAAMAFHRFAEESVDIAFIETGLGGRLDATNVVEPELSIITTISLDHTEMLGDTLAKIASEKAGIIKAGKPVLMGNLPGEAAQVVCSVAEERGCPLYVLADRFADEAHLPKTNLEGGFQRWNAALAVYATEILAERFPVQRTGALESVEWAGRWQRVEFAGRTLIFDASHNPEGVAALEGNLTRLVESDGCKPIIIAGTLGEDRARSLMEVVERHAREIYLVEPNQDRATSCEFMEGCLSEESECSVYHTDLKQLFASPKGGRVVPNAPSDAKRFDKDIEPYPVALLIGQPGDTIVVTGSIYLIGEILERIQGSGMQDGSGLQDRV